MTTLILTPSRLYLVAFLNALGILWPVLYAMALWAASRQQKESEEDDG